MKVTKKPYLEEDNIDKVFRVYIGLSIIYYAADFLIKLYEMRAEDYMDLCKLGFFLHHALTMLSFKGIFVVDHYPWFLTGPMAYHTMLVAFPNFPLNSPLYLGTLVAWGYNLTRSPFWEKKICKALFATSIIIMLPIIMLWLGSCLQEFKWEE